MSREYARESDAVRLVRDAYREGAEWAIRIAWTNLQLGEGCPMQLSEPNKETLRDIRSMVREARQAKREAGHVSERLPSESPPAQQEQ